MAETVEVAFLEMHRRSSSQRNAVKKAKKRAHRGTNFAKVKPKPGYKRVKIGNHYVLVKMSSKEKNSRKKTARRLKSIKPPKKKH